MTRSISKRLNSNVYTDHLLTAAECRSETLSEPSLYSFKCFDVSDIVGDQTAELYSRIGLTYVINARVSILRSRLVNDLSNN